MDDMQKENILVELEDGSTRGPYEATVAGSTVVIWDAMADLDDAEKILQYLPNGKHRALSIASYEFYRESDGGGIGDHYQVEIGQRATVSSALGGVTHNYNIGSGANVQIGDANRQEINYFVEQMRERIRMSEASDEQKSEAYGLLDNFVAHPVISSIIGSAAWNAIAQATS